MKPANYNEAVAAFANYESNLPSHSPGEIKVEPIYNGLINQSYKVSCGLKPSFLLQQINKNVFAQPQNVQENYIQIWQYAEFEFTGLRLPSPKYYNLNSTLFVDSNKNYWRAFEFIENTHSLNVAGNPELAKATAKAFGKFTATFTDFDIDLLKNVIPDFHNLTSRYEQMEKAKKGDLYELIGKALPITDELKQRERYKHFYEIVTESEEFPKRVMHHDAKINNVLFNNKTGKVVCLVDFDTVMSGYYFSDVGDLIRSMACSRDENSLEFNKLNIRKSYYKAIVDEYLSLMEKHFTVSEKKYIHYSGLFMIYMQSLRFITDYMNGEIYYRTSYKGQNLDRALNQLTLLKRMEEFLEKEYQFKI